MTWISVKDQKPPWDKEVIVFYDYSEMGNNPKDKGWAAVRIHHAVIDGIDQYYLMGVAFEYPEEDFDFCYEHITHWSVGPEPPKELT